LTGAERHCAAGSDRNADLPDDIALPFQPDRIIDDGKSHTLRAHDALETGGLTWFDLGGVKAYNDFPALQSRFARAKEHFLQGDAAVPLWAGYFNLGIQAHQAYRSVGSGQGVGNVTAQRGDVAYLRPADQVTGFDQSPGVGSNQRVPRDARERHACADEKAPIP
jgi:hypothetical protein